jgi:predicted ferric reductase
MNPNIIIETTYSYDHSWYIAFWIIISFIVIMVLTAILDVTIHIIKNYRYKYDVKILEDIAQIKMEIK